MKNLFGSYAFSLVLLFSFLFLASCNSHGPLHRDDKPTEAFEHKFYYYLKPTNQFYLHDQRADLVIRGAQSIHKEVEKNYFILRIMGRTQTNSVEIRTYEGYAYRRGDNLELWSRNCFLYKKKDWEAETVPVKSWRCDHLIFAFQSPSNFRKREALLKVSKKITSHSDWLDFGKLYAVLPGNDESSRLNTFKNPFYFTGQVIPLEEDPNTVVVWSYRAYKLVRDGDMLQTLDDRGLAGPKLKVISRIGDFILCESNKVKGNIKLAYLNKSPRRASSFF